MWVIWVHDEPWNLCPVTQYNKHMYVVGPLVTLKSLEVPEDHGCRGRRIPGLDSEGVGSNCPVCSPDIHGHPVCHPGPLPLSLVDILVRGEGRTTQPGELTCRVPAALCLGFCPWRGQ